MAALKTPAAAAADAADAIRNKRTLADDLKEIIQVTHPKARHLNGWHLERLALGEYGDQTPQDIHRAIKEIKKDMASSRALIAVMLEREKEWNDRREAFTKAKRQQQAAMAEELTIAKEIVHKMHVVGELESPEEALAAILAQPAPVEARLLESATAHHSSTGASSTTGPVDDQVDARNVIDLSHTPSI
ncbi:hypothetical protein DYB32_003233 [Aphanomyces invadans]|uniref:Uncharacterized protein n=1 Tax=Aphanomyces invadans TaxID=157072 RepID=A0A3R7ABG8_9STRA|nr:hypothetical protein DYB32_003233 [Aphanomyces invadans]